MKPIILSLFDLTGNMVRPWVDSGNYEGICVDLEPAPNEPGITHLQADMLEWVPDREIIDRVAFVASFPPCTDIAVSGAKHFKNKGLGRLSKAIELFSKAVFWGEWFGKPYFVENPVSTISSYYRKPDFLFHPWEYSGYCMDDCYTKKTCLWTGNGFVMPEPNHPHGIEPDDRIHKAPPGPNRANFRSATPMGFARAVYEANK